MKEIIIDIFDNGEIKLETKGFQGPSCKAESEFLKDTLGKELENQLTPAYFENETVKKKKWLTLCG